MIGFYQFETTRQEVEERVRRQTASLLTSAFLFRALEIFMASRRELEILTE